jgi:hypothetical protein
VEKLENKANLQPLKAKSVDQSILQLPVAQLKNTDNVEIEEALAPGHITKNDDSGN